VHRHCVSNTSRDQRVEEARRKKRSRLTCFEWVGSVGGGAVKRTEERAAVSSTSVDSDSPGRFGLKCEDLTPLGKNF